VIGRKLLQGDSQEVLEGAPVVDLGLQFRIGIYSEPLLEEETFQKKKRGIGCIAFVTFADRVISYQNRIDASPIDSGIDLFHSFDSAVMFERIGKSEVDKGEVGIDFFEAHGSSKQQDLKELWQKN
jgi:hypothetical protein